MFKGKKSKTQSSDKVQNTEKQNSKNTGSTQCNTTNWQQKKGAHRFKYPERVKVKEDGKRTKGGRVTRHKKTYKIKHDTYKERSNNI